MQHPMLQHFVPQVKYIDMCVYATLNLVFLSFSPTIRHYYTFIQVILESINFHFLRLYRFKQFEFQSNSTGCIRCPNKIIESRIAIDVSLEDFFPETFIIDVLNRAKDSLAHAVGDTRVVFFIGGVLWVVTRVWVVDTGLV